MLDIYVIIGEKIKREFIWKKSKKIHGLFIWSNEINCVPLSPTTTLTNYNYKL